jgi:hypothetical protein
MVLCLIPVKLSGFNLFFTILLCYLNTIECIPERPVNCSDLWDLLWLLLTEASSYFPVTGWKHSMNTLNASGIGKSSKVVLDKGNSKSYNNINWS